MGDLKLTDVGDKSAQAQVASDSGIFRDRDFHDHNFLHESGGVPAATTPAAAGKTRRPKTMKLAKSPCKILWAALGFRFASSRRLLAQSTPAPSELQRPRQYRAAPPPAAKAPRLCAGANSRMPDSEARSISAVDQQKEDGEGHTASRQSRTGHWHGACGWHRAFAERDDRNGFQSRAARVFHPRRRSLVRRRRGKDWIGWSHVSRKFQRRVRETGGKSGDETNLRECRRAAMRIMWRSWGPGAVLALGLILSNGTLSAEISR